MKILFTVEFYEPHKGGAEEVVKQLAERLVKFGHQVTVATSFIPERKEKRLNGVELESFKIFGNLALGIGGTEEEILRYQSFLKQDWDVVVNYAAQTWTTDLTFGVLDEIKAKKILIPCGYSGLLNSSYTAYLQKLPPFLKIYNRLKNLGKRLLLLHKTKAADYKGYFEQLPTYLEKYDSLVYMSFNYQDKLFGDAHGLGYKAVLIPNGASEKEFLIKDKFKIKEKLGIKTKYLAITVANHYLAKGHDFVIRAFKQIKSPDITLLIIGKIPAVGIRKIAHSFVGCYPYCKLSSILDRRIRLVDGSDRELVLSAYKNADFFLFGSYIEYAPLVMYESFASKTLFITRDVGNVKDHREVVKIVNSPAQMATMVEFYLNHPEKRKEITEKAFQLWQDNYTWDKIAKKYEELFCH